MRIVLIINKGTEQKCERKVQKYKDRAEKSETTQHSLFHHIKVPLAQ